RGKNLLGFNEYYEAIDKGEKPWFESEKVDNPKEYEYMLGLRLLQEGIVPTEENIKITCEKLKNDGYLEIKSGKYLLTRKGIFFANYVFEQVL
nr:coproporphyrinogen III oxidase family protein [Fusobacteriaceae bacterium]